MPRTGHRRLMAAIWLLVACCCLGLGAATNGLPMSGSELHRSSAPHHHTHTLATSRTRTPGPARPAPSFLLSRRPVQKHAQRHSRQFDAVEAVRQALSLWAPHPFAPLRRPPPPPPPPSKAPTKKWRPHAAEDPHGGASRPPPRMRTRSLDGDLSSTAEDSTAVVPPPPDSSTGADDTSTGADDTSIPLLELSSTGAATDDGHDSSTTGALEDSSSTANEKHNVTWSHHPCSSSSSSSTGAHNTTSAPHNATSAPSSSAGAAHNTSHNATASSSTGASDVSAASTGVTIEEVSSTAAAADDDSDAEDSSGVTCSRAFNSPELDTIYYGDSELLIVFWPPTDESDQCVPILNFLFTDGVNAPISFLRADIEPNMDLDGALVVSIVGLTNGVEYNVTVQATNGNYYSPIHGWMQATPATTPGAPIVTTVIAGDQSVVLSFLPPTTDGGSAITLYTATSVSGVVATATSSPILFTGLTNGWMYQFVIVASNQMGNGVPSDPTAIVIPQPAPGAPFVFAVQSGLSKKLRVYFFMPLSNTAIIESYRIVARSSVAVLGGTQVRTNTQTVLSSPADLTNLVDGTLYNLTVTAVSTSSGPVSNEVSLISSMTAPSYSFFPNGTWHGLCFNGTFNAANITAANWAMLATLTPHNLYSCVSSTGGARSSSSSSSSTGAHVSSTAAVSSNTTTAASTSPAGNTTRIVSSTGRDASSTGLLRSSGVESSTGPASTGDHGGNTASQSFISSTSGSIVSGSSTGVQGYLSSSSSTGVSSDDVISFTSSTGATGAPEGCVRMTILVDFSQDVWSEPSSFWTTMVSQWAQVIQVSPSRMRIYTSRLVTTTQDTGTNRQARVLLSTSQSIELTVDVLPGTTSDNLSSSTDLATRLTNDLSDSDSDVGQILVKWGGNVSTVKSVANVATTVTGTAPLGTDHDSSSLLDPRSPSFAIGLSIGVGMVIAFFAGLGIFLYRRRGSSAAQHPKLPNVSAALTPRDQKSSTTIDIDEQQQQHAIRGRTINVQQRYRPASPFDAESPYREIAHFGNVHPQHRPISREKQLLHLERRVEWTEGHLGGGPEGAVNFVLDPMMPPLTIRAHSAPTPHDMVDGGEYRPNVYPDLSAAAPPQPHQQPDGQYKLPASGFHPALHLAQAQDGEQIDSSSSDEEGGNHADVEADEPQFLIHNGPRPAAPSFGFAPQHSALPPLTRAPSVPPAFVIAPPPRLPRSLAISASSSAPHQPHQQHQPPPPRFAPAAAAFSLPDPHRRPNPFSLGGLGGGAAPEIDRPIAPFSFTMGRRSLEERPAPPLPGLLPLWPTPAGPIMPLLEDLCDTDRSMNDRTPPPHYRTPSRSPFDE